MVVSTIPVPGSKMVQQDLGYTNFVFSDQMGVLYRPDPNISQGQVGYFYYTAAPPVLNNFAWNQIKLNWTRNYITTAPEEFEALITLEGILLNGQVDLLAEKLITSLTGTAVTEDIIFDLRSNRSVPSLTKIAVGTATSGKVQVNLPKRWLNFESDSMVLKRAWLDGWSKRKVQPITAGSETLDSHPVKITLTYDADMKSDFSDVRFIHSDGRTPLCAYLYSYTASTSAVFYVNYPNSNEGRNIYVQYGNSTATLVSNIDNVFTFADDFNDNSLDTTKWETVSGGGGSVAETNQEIRITSDGTNRIYLKSKEEFDPDFTLEFRAKRSENIEAAWGWDGVTSGGTDTPYNGYFLQYRSWLGTPDITLFKYVNGTATTMESHAVTLAANYDDYRVESYLDGDDVINKVYLNDVEIIDSTDAGTPFTSGFIGFTARETPAALNAYYDFVRVHGYSETAPAAGTIGSEESTITVDPDTATEDDTSILFTLPADWSAASPACLESTEIHHTVFDTNDIPISARDILEHGISGADVYMGMRIRAQILGDVNTYVKFNSASYAYEVI